MENTKIKCIKSINMKIKLKKNSRKAIKRTILKRLKKLSIKKISIKREKYEPQ